MTILVDENVDQSTSEALKALGHSVLDVRATDLEGAPDETLWELAQRERALLLSTDRDYLRYRAEPHFGLIVVSLRQPNREKLHARFMEILGQTPADEWPGKTVSARDVAITVWHGPRP